VKYAGMQITSDTTVTISTINEWTTVGTYTTGALDGWSMASNVFTPSSTDTYGYFFLEYAVSCTTANANGDSLEFGVFIGDYLHPEFSTMRRLRSGTDIASICGIGIFKVDGPDSTVTLKVRNKGSTNNVVIRKSLVGTQQIRYVHSDTPLPISLNSFDIEQQGHAVKLSWQTASEIENLGYKIYRKENDGVFEEISSYAYNDALRGQGTTTEMHDYEFIDTGVEPAQKYTYLLSDVSYQLEEVKHIDFIRTIYLPEGVKLGKACPNPFNPQCVVPFTIDVHQRVRIDLLDVLGRRICTLTDRDYDPGNFQLWINNPKLCSGIYFIRAQAGNQIEVQKIMMMK
ncbi:MAG: T9SS type A sorting domain-containing protein, partial [Candidatus Marinimicrobia bacterium]|nr:T9SS type A sorting domain-containing protein [Candidatus Neomarinimicrobiota bacterium]